MLALARCKRPTILDGMLRCCYALVFQMAGLCAKICIIGDDAGWTARPQSSPRWWGLCWLSLYYSCLPALVITCLRDHRLIHIAHCCHQCAHLLFLGLCRLRYFHDCNCMYHGSCQYPEKESTYGYHYCCTTDFAHIVLESSSVNICSTPVDTRLAALALFKKRSTKQALSDACLQSFGIDSKRVFAL